MRQRKFTRGNPILSIGHLVAYMARRDGSGDYIFLLASNRPIHSKFVENMTLKTVMGFVGTGWVSEAIIAGHKLATIPPKPSLLPGSSISP
jgi:hypothetical protein